MALAGTDGAGSGLMETLLVASLASFGLLHACWDLADEMIFAARSGSVPTTPTLTLVEGDQAA